MTQMFLILELMTYCRKHLVSQIKLKIYIRKAAVKCMSQGVSKVFVSVIVQNPESLLEEVNEKISFMRKNNNFIFSDNSNISNIHLFDGGLHLVELGRCILANNVIDRINNFLLTHRHQPNIHIHTME